MPVDFIKDEDIWNKAKDAFKKSYDKEPKDSNDFAIVTAIYKKMGGKFKSSAKEMIERLKGQLKEAITEENIICLNVPLLIRLFEHFNENNFEDQYLHFVVENMLHEMKEKDSLSMDDYEELIQQKSEEPEVMMDEPEMESLYSGILKKLKEL